MSTGHGLGCQHYIILITANLISNEIVLFGNEDMHYHETSRDSVDPCKWIIEIKKTSKPIISKNFPLSCVPSYWFLISYNSGSLFNNLYILFEIVVFIKNTNTIFYVMSILGTDTFHLFGCAITLFDWFQSIFFANYQPRTGPKTFEKKK